MRDARRGLGRYTWCRRHRGGARGARCRGSRSPRGRRRAAAEAARWCGTTPRCTPRGCSSARWRPRAARTLGTPPPSPTSRLPQARARCALIRCAAAAPAPKPAPAARSFAVPPLCPKPAPAARSFAAPAALLPPRPPSRGERGRGRGRGRGRQLLGGGEHDRRRLPHPRAGAPPAARALTRGGRALTRGGRGGSGRTSCG